MEGAIILQVRATGHQITWASYRDELGQCKMKGKDLGIAQDRCCFLVASLYGMQRQSRGLMHRRAWDGTRLRFRFSKYGDESGVTNK